MRKKAHREITTSSLTNIFIQLLPYWKREILFARLALVLLMRTFKVGNCSSAYKDLFWWKKKRNNPFTTTVFHPYNHITEWTHTGKTSARYLPDGATMMLPETEQNERLNLKEEIQRDWETLSCQEVTGLFQQITSFPLEMDKKFTGFWSSEQSLTQKERWFQRRGAGLHIYRSQAYLTGQRASKD